jgi:hypothetical protein
VWAKKQWFLGGSSPADYETLLVLAGQLKARTGASYRIAYLSARYVRNGVNALHAGGALLYNADRLRNTTTLVNAWAVRHDDRTVTGVHMRASFPCTNPPASHPSGCALLDGDGRHWMSSYLHPGTGEWEFGPQAAAFELVTDPGKHLLVYNVHAHPATDPGSYPSIRALVDATESRWRSRPKLLPPLVVGDFNGEPELTDFDVTARVDPGGVDFVLTGKPGIHSATQSFTTEVEVHPRQLPDRPHCGTLSTLVSDHCAIFVQYLPRP